jgi:hypothetical protein
MKTVCEVGFYDMKAIAEKINPEDYILSVLSTGKCISRSFRLPDFSLKHESI